MALEGTISSTGFINYFPSSERTQRAIDEAFRKYGPDIAIIDGEDDWNASSVFHIWYLLEKFNINKIADFHTGISGITKSGAVIAKEDLPKFIKCFNASKWKFFREDPRNMEGTISIYDNEEKTWKIFFSLKVMRNVITDLYGRKTTRNEVHNLVNNFKTKKNTYLWPA